MRGPAEEFGGGDREDQRTATKPHRIDRTRRNSESSIEHGLTEQNPEQGRLDHGKVHARAPGRNGDRVIVEALEGKVLALGVDLVLAVLLVPLGEPSGLVHLFYYLTEAHARVVRAEAHLADLGSVRDDAHFGPA